MVRPDHIEEAERIGMPEDEPEMIECAWCERPCNKDDIVKCEVCGKYLCEKCRIDMGKILNGADGNFICDDPDRQCVIRYLISVIEQNESYIQKLQTESDKDDELTKAAKKAATTGNHKDLQEYLRSRKENNYDSHDIKWQGSET